MTNLQRFETTAAYLYFIQENTCGYCYITRKKESIIWHRWWRQVFIFRIIFYIKILRMSKWWNCNQLSLLIYIFLQDFSRGIQSALRPRCVIDKGLRCTPYWLSSGESQCSVLELPVGHIRDYRAVTLSFPSREVPRMHLFLYSWSQLLMRSKFQKEFRKPTLSTF